MNYDQYVKAAEQASKLVEVGEHERAAAALEALLASDIADLDKALMCINLAIVRERQGHIAETLAWYDRGMRYEQPYHRFAVAERKAAYLAEQGRDRESLVIYEDLLGKPYMMESDKVRMRHNAEVLRARISK